MTNEMTKMKVRVTLLEDMLGTAPDDKEIYSKFIASNAPEDKDTTDEVESLPGESVEDEDTGRPTVTVFHRDPEGNPIIFDYLIKGFFKNACSMLRNCSNTESSKIKAFKKYIDGLVFIDERMISINMNGKLSLCKRPLRAQTAKGERVAISISESIPAGSTMEFTITVLKKDLMKTVIEWMDYGVYNGLGQWHNSGKDRFTWEDITDK